MRVNVLSTAVEPMIITLGGAKEGIAPTGN